MFGHKHKFEVNYLYRGEPRATVIEAAEEHYPHGLAARYLVQQHCAESGTSIEAVMPEPDADDARLLQQAEALGLSDIRVTRLPDKPGAAPGHYQQP